jgi:hypothetical protein
MMIVGAVHRSETMKAILIGWNPKTDDVIQQPVISIDQGWGVKRSIEGDYPGYDWIVLADAEARKVHADNVVREITGG